MASIAAAGNMLSADCLSMYTIISNLWVYYYYLSSNKHTTLNSFLSTLYRTSLLSHNTYYLIITLYPTFNVIITLTNKKVSFLFVYFPCENVNHYYHLWIHKYMPMMQMAGRRYAGAVPIAPFPGWIVHLSSCTNALCCSDVCIVWMTKWYQYVYISRWNHC